MEVIMVLRRVSRCLRGVWLDMDTYMDPTAKIAVNPIFCFVGICKPQMVGIGIAIKITSVTIPITAVAM